MFVHYRTKGFILKKEDRNEADRIFTIFTQEFGKLELLAKAERKIKSKLRSGLELFYLSDIEFIQGKTQKTVTDAILLDNHRVIRDNLLKLSACHKIAEVFDALVKCGERDERLWELLADIFARINQGGGKISSIGLSFYYFLWNLFIVLGYGPNLRTCARCGRNINAEHIFFSSSDSGLLCEKCKNLSMPGIEVSENAVKIVRIFMQKDQPLLVKLKVSGEDLAAVKIFSDYYLEKIFDIMSVSECQGSSPKAKVLIS